MFAWTSIAQIQPIPRTQSTVLAKSLCNSYCSTSKSLNPDLWNLKHGPYIYVEAIITLFGTNNQKWQPPLKKKLLTKFRVFLIPCVSRSKWLFASFIWISLNVMTKGCYLSAANTEIYCFNVNHLRCHVSIYIYEGHVRIMSESNHDIRSMSKLHQIFFYWFTTLFIYEWTFVIY